MREGEKVSRTEFMRVGEKGGGEVDGQSLVGREGGVKRK
jgi:hypothetical protein